MATAENNLSHFDKQNVPSASGYTFGIVVSEWNGDITSNLLKGATEALEECGASEENILVKYVPGSFELPIGAQFLLEHKNVDVVICLGSVIQGETKHFDFVCQACAQGVKDVGLKYNKPVIFGVLTDNTKEQAEARSGGKLGNKGVEAAISAIKMAHLQKNLT